MRHSPVFLVRGITLSRVIGTVLICLLSLGSVPAEATSIKHQDIVHLIDLSEVILVGTVTSVTDGFDNKVPFTEVTLAVGETIKGPATRTYTFRQFGLMAPRDMGNGRTYLGVSPDGWPRFKSGEEVFLFLYKKGNMTGLRTTVGLLQGKFTRVDGGFVNEIANQGLFQRVSAGAGLLTPGEEKMLKVKRGPLDAKTFVSFVRRAVEENWVGSRKLDRVR